MSFRVRTIFQQIRARPRLAFAALFGALIGVFLPDAMVPHTVTRFIVGWNVGACLYIVLVTIMMVNSSEARMQRRARLQDEGRALILFLVIVGAVTCLLAIVAQLAIVKDMKGTERYAHIALALLTIVSSWVFTHITFALQYAHDYYVVRSQGRPGGLEFPGDDHPEYGDFVYLSFIVGTSGQTADVSFSSKAMRRLGTMHCVLAFVFNTTVLALTINIAASLF